MGGNAATTIDWFSYVKDSGASAVPLLLGALIWMNAERRRLLEENKEKDEKIEALATQVITLAAEIKTFLFNERKAP